MQILLSFAFSLRTLYVLNFAVSHFAFWPSSDQPGAAATTALFERGFSSHNKAKTHGTACAYKFTLCYIR